MAGIIGQLTAHARKRKGISTVDIEKSAYILPPFHSYGYRPSVDNKYVVNRPRVQLTLILEEKDTEFIQEWFLEKKVQFIRRRYNYGDVNIDNLVLK